MMPRISVLFENPKYDVNVDTMARTCSFYGVRYYTTESQHLSNSRSGGAVRAGDGPVVIQPQKWNGRIIATDSTFATHPADFSFQDGDLIVFGNEVNGVIKELRARAQGCIGVPQQGQNVKCLNVSAAAASILGIIQAKYR